VVDVPGQTVVAVLTRAPSDGGKTRLFRALGRTCDARLLAALFLDTLDAVRITGFSVVVAFTPPTAAREISSLASDAILVPQREGDLGARMCGVFDDLFGAGARAVLLVGSDLPTLRPAIVRHAADTLIRDEDAVVLGPATDGGYYLIGATRTPFTLFDGIEWSTDRVLEQTLITAQAAGLRTVLLSQIADVDTPNQLERIAAAGVGAVRTRAWVRRNM
jgi:uncharacterized protein